MATEKRLIDANAFDCVCVNGKSDDFCNGVLYVLDMIDAQPTVDAVEVADMKEFAEAVAYQFGYYCQNEGRLHITHGGLSTLELTFYILGWENPHPVPECECEVDGCHEHATCGIPTADGYKRVCGQHFRSIRAKMDGDGNA
jgi:hypothetical protein